MARIAIAQAQSQFANMQLHAPDLICTQKRTRIRHFKLKWCFYQ